MNKTWWRKRALKWRKRYLAMKIERTKWRKQSDIWQEDCEDCEEELAECKEEPDPQPDPAIKSLTIKNGKFIVNGKVTKLIGVSKREMICASAGVVPDLSYDPYRVKKSIIASNTNYIRVLAPKDLVFFRQEVIDYLEAGKVVEVELFDAGKPDREYQAHWKNTFNAARDLPVFFDAHNEFVDKSLVSEVNTIVNYIVDHGGLICAGAWGSSNYGEKYSKEFKAMNNKYQIVSHHREWTKASIEGDREPGKPLVWNEIHTMDNNLEAAKTRLKLGYLICEGVQLYPLGNFDKNNGAKFQQILDYAGSLVK